MNSLLTIVIPCYNSEKYLEECLNSLQDDKNFSQFLVIFVDDGSTDGTLASLSRIKASFENVIVLTQGNKGQASARNRGIDFADSKYIGFIDSDDRVSKNYFSNLIDNAESRDADVAFCKMTSVSQNGIEDELNARPHSLDQFEFLSLSDDSIKKTLIKDFFLDRISVSPCNKIIKLPLIREHGLRFPEGLLNEDMQFCFELLIHARTLTKTDRSTYYYIQHASSSTTRNDLKVLDMLTVIDNISSKIDVRFRPQVQEEFRFFDLFFSCYLTFIRSLSSSNEDWRKIKLALSKRLKKYSLFDLTACVSLRPHHKLILILFRFSPNLTYSLTRILWQLRHP